MECGFVLRQDKVHTEHHEGGLEGEGRSQWTVKAQLSFLKLFLRTVYFGLSQVGLG